MIIAGSQCLATPQLHFISQFMQNAILFSFLANTPCSFSNNLYNQWHLRKLTLEGKMTIFTSLAISKIVLLAIITKVPNTLRKYSKSKKLFLWGKIKTKQNKKVKIKQNTLRNDYKDRGLKIVDTENKIVRLKCSWVRWLYTENFHERKIIPLQYIRKLFG